MDQRDWLLRACIIRLTNSQRSQAGTKQLLERYHALATEDPFHHTCAHVCLALWSARQRCLRGLSREIWLSMCAAPAARGWLDGRISGRIFGHK